MYIFSTATSMMETSTQHPSTMLQSPEGGAQVEPPTVNGGPADDNPPTTQDHQNTATETAQEPQPSKSSQRKRRKRHSKPHILTQITLRKSQWSYIHLQHLHASDKSPEDLDAVTAHMHLTAALTQFLGLHGSAIPFDILKLSSQDVWIRLAAEDQSAVVAAVGGWVSRNGEGWRVKGWSSWDAGVVGSERGQDLFTD
jgi:ribonuclease P/MRP protein subunit POP8